uniref:Uncharacterized protein n=1 Tax=Manihot esculenta TaxID=3983 RepID=A0A2C9W8I4_MANES
MIKVSRHFRILIKKSQILGCVTFKADCHPASQVLFFPPRDRI